LVKLRVKVWELKLGKIRMPYPQWGIREWIFVIIIDELDPPQCFLRAGAMDHWHSIGIAFGRYHLTMVLCDD